MMKRSFAGFRILVPIFISVVAVAGFAPGAAAQQTAEAETTILAGVVVDAASGAQIPGAAVVLTERGRPAITDRQGRFSFPDVSPGTRTLIVTQLGYDSLRADVQFVGGAEPVIVRLLPDPIALEKITVVADGFERRKSMGSRVLDRLTLLNAAGLSVLDVVRAKTGIAPVPCPERLAMGSCAFVRGRQMRVSVFVDGASLLGGIDVLDRLRPEELYYLEVLGGGRTIRAYTTWYMETVASGRRMPAEFFF